MQLHQHRTMNYALKIGPPHPPLFAFAGALRSFFAADLVEMLRVMLTLERAVNLLFGFIGLFIAFFCEAGSAAARYGLWLCVRRLARQRSELLSRAVDYSLNGPCWCSLSRAAPRVSHVCAISH